MSRSRFVVRRLLQAIPLLLAITFFVFLLLKIAPGDPARLVAGVRAPDERVAEIRTELGLDDSVFTQYVSYLGRVFSGDLGESVRAQQPVTDIIRDSAPVTLWLVVVGTAMSLLISLPQAILAARRPDSGSDQAIRGFSLFGLTMPPFWIAIVLLVAVALPTGWFPVGGFGESFGDKVRSIALPGLTLAISLAPLQIRSMRSAVIDVLNADYVSVAHALGVSERRLLGRHVIRNALPPTVTILALQLGYVLFGAVVIEQAFALPGLGRAMVQAAAQRDFAVVQGLTLLFAVAVVVINIAADVVNSILDPRVSL